MAKISQKMAVLAALQRHGSEISLPDLLEKLDGEFAPRSVRRWLKEFAEEGLVSVQGKKRGTRYFAVQPSNTVKENSPDYTHSQIFSKASLEALSQVNKSLFERDPTGYSHDWLNNYSPNQTFFLTEKQRLELHSSGQRDQNKAPAGTYARKIYNRLLIDLSYNSSRLEGNTFSLLDTEKLLIDGISPDQKLTEERVMILNHKEAIRYLVDNAATLTPNFNSICTLHYLLSDGLLATELTGKIRQHDVRIGGSTYLPMSGNRQLENELQKICIKANAINDPYEQSLFLLVFLAYLQPFSDVNKRTSRLSANIPLVKNNLVPLSFNEVPTNDYTAAIISAYELNMTQPIVELFIYSYLRTCKLYNVTIESLGFDEVRVRYRSQRRDLIAELIKSKLFGNAINAFILQQSTENIPEVDRKAFIDDVIEDIDLLSRERIAGMGLTETELTDWQTGQAKRQRSTK